jgi:hypothetical protein
MIQRRRPQLELLEDRTLLNNRFVVATGAPVDNATTFATLQAALTTPGLVTGDTIQINAGSAPGSVINANLTSAFTSATSLTIQGDPAAAGSIPLFSISDATTIAAADTLTLNNVNVGLINTEQQPDRRQCVRDQRQQQRPARLLQRRRCHRHRPGGQ